MKDQLIKRFGEARVLDIPVKEGDVPLLMLDLELATPVNVLLTNGLHKKRMNVPEKDAGKEHIELFFCLPSYWEWEDMSNPNTNWVFDSIQRLAKFLQENDTWFGNGHTMAANPEKGPISNTMKQDHFVLLNPLLLERELAPLNVQNTEVHFLAIVPVFYEEWDYKQSKGTVKLVKKFINKGVSEKLDDFRQSVLRSRFRFW